MGPIESVKTCLRKIFDFSGRATRSEFWWFQLFIVLMGVVLKLLDLLIFGNAAGINIVDVDIAQVLLPHKAPEIGYFAITFQLFSWIPTASSGARRLHDTNRPGWIVMLPVIGIVIVHFAEKYGLNIWFGQAGFLLAVISMFWLILFFAFNSHEHTNRYGTSPKYDNSPDVFD